VQDRDGAKSVLKRSRARFPFLEKVYADGGYAGRLICPLNLLSVLVLERRNGPWDEDRQQRRRGRGTRTRRWRGAG